MKTKLNNITTYRPDEYVMKSSEILINAIEDLLAKKEIINIALSGGSSPIPIYEKMKKSSLDWNRIQFFLVDERCVSINDTQNNFKNIKNCFFDYISSNHYPIVKEDVSYKDAAQQYQELIEKKIPSKNGIPEFDLILLGMGLDGHTASLFPETKAITNTKDLIVLNEVHQQNATRITMTYPLILNAKKIILLIKGDEKRKVFEKALIEDLPISKIIPQINIILN